MNLNLISFQIALNKSNNINVEIKLRWLYIMVPKLFI